MWYHNHIVFVVKVAIKILKKKTLDIGSVHVQITKLTLYTVKSLQDFEHDMVGQDVLVILYTFMNNSYKHRNDLIGTRVVKNSDTGYFNINNPCDRQVHIMQCHI